jgi:hypothetical protein
MAKEVYAQKGRKMRGLTAGGAMRTIELQQPTIGEDGGTALKNDLSDAHHDVFIDVGPSSESKRGATISKLTRVLQFVTDPEESKVLVASIMTNMDGEGLSELRDYYRQKLVRIGAVKPNEEEQNQMAQEAQNQQPDANTAFLMAEAGKSQANAAKAAAQTEQIKVETAKTMSEISASQQDQAIKAAEALRAALTQNPESTPPVNAGE